MAYTLPNTNTGPARAHRGVMAQQSEEWYAVRSASQDRQQAFEAEIMPHLDAAYRLARVLTGHEQDAEDLVQEAYLRAFAGFKGYQRGSNARAWLLTILRRVFLNDRRSRRGRPFLVSLSGAHEDDEPIDPADTQSAGPEEEVLRTFDRAAILEGLATLPESYRSVLALVDLQGLRYAEAAEVLECPPGTVMSRLHRARLQLARYLQGIGFTEERRQTSDA